MKLLWLLFIPSLAFGQIIGRSGFYVPQATAAPSGITFLGSGDTSSAATTTLSGLYTASSGSNTVAVLSLVCLKAADNIVVDSIYMNNTKQTIALVGAQYGAAYSWQFVVHRVVNPPTGTDVPVKWYLSESRLCGGGVAVFSGVDQTTPIDSDNLIDTSTATGTEIGATITSATGKMAILMNGTAEAYRAFSSGGDGESVAFYHPSGSPSATPVLSATYKAGASSVTMLHTFAAGNEARKAIAFSLNAAP